MKQVVVLVLSALSAFTVTPAGAADSAEEVHEVRIRPVPRLENLVRNSDGSVKRMKFREAEGYCRSRGTRLPTARELALVAAQAGASGPKSTAFPRVTPPAAGVLAEMRQMRAEYDAFPVFGWESAAAPRVRSYYPGPDPGLQRVLFYHSYQGYLPPAGDPNFCPGGRVSSEETYAEELRQKRQGEYPRPAYLAAWASRLVWSSNIVPVGNRIDFDEERGVKAARVSTQINYLEFAKEEPGEAYHLDTCSGQIGSNAFWWPGLGVRCLAKEQ